MPDPKVIRFDQARSASAFAGAGPTFRPEDWRAAPRSGGIIFRTPEIGLSAGIWECNRLYRKDGTHPSMNSCSAEGEITTIVEAGGKSTTIGAGESFIIPRGLQCQWRQPGQDAKVLRDLLSPCWVALIAASGLTVIKPRPRSGAARNPRQPLRRRP